MMSKKTAVSTSSPVGDALPEQPPEKKHKAGKTLTFEGNKPQPMSFPVSKRLFTVQEYFKMGEAGILPEKGVELINGEIIEMSPIGSKHLACVNKLNAILTALLGTNAIVSVQNPVILEDLTVPEPDFSILRFREDFYASGVPKAKDVLLVIEVADTSIEYDRTIKLPLYAKNGIPEYWLINLEKDEVEAYWEPSGTDYKFRELIRPGDVLQSRGLEIKLETDFF